MLRSSFRFSAALVTVLGCASHRSTSAAPAADARPASVTDARIAQGAALFSNGSCTKCHGPGGNGGANGPSLTRGTWLHVDGGYDAIVGIITRGVAKEEIKVPSHQFNMRPRGGMQPQLTDDQVQSVAAYVWSISRGK